VKKPPEIADARTSAVCEHIRSQRIAPAPATTLW
jgi:hypothetical protein